MKTLLVLEDEMLVMKLLRHMLKQYSLVEATGAEQAIRLFKEHTCQIDLLIADVTLPASSGVQVAIALRSEFPDLPVVLTSGYPVSSWSRQDSADLKRLGAHSVVILEKPIPATALSNAICELIGLPQSERVRSASGNPEAS